MDDFANLKVWSGVAGAAFEHRKLKRDSDGAFPDVQSPEKRLEEKWPNLRTHCIANKAT